MIVFRCDGDARVGAGHVARCRQIARAFVDAGSEVLFVGRYSGTAAALLESASFPTTEPVGPGLGIPDDATAVIVDSYELEPAEIERSARGLPLACIVDHLPPPQCSAVISYHPDAAARISVPEGACPILGLDYAPVSPEYLNARRRRELAKALVTIGGGTLGSKILPLAVEALSQLGDLEIFVAAPPGTELPPSARNDCVTVGFSPGGLVQRIAWADLAISAAGSTPYDLACAGVPAVLVPIADNQRPIAAAFAGRGLAFAADINDAVAPTLSDVVRRLGDPGERARLAAAGPAAVDGYGAFRIRDALTACWSGRPLPTPLRYLAEGGEVVALRGPEEVAVLRLSVSDGELELGFGRVGPGTDDGVLARVVRETAELMLAARKDLTAVRAPHGLGDRCPSLDGGGIRARRDGDGSVLLVRRR